MTTKTTTGLGPVQARKRLGVVESQFDALVRHHQLVGPDEDGRPRSAK